MILLWTVVPSYDRTLEPPKSPKLESESFARWQAGEAFTGHPMEL